MSKHARVADCCAYKHGLLPLETVDSFHHHSDHSLYLSLSSNFCTFASTSQFFLPTSLRVAAPALPSDMEANNRAASTGELASAGPATAPGITSQPVGVQEASPTTGAPAMGQSGQVVTEEAVNAGTPSFWRFKWLFTWISDLLAKLASLKLGALFIAAAYRMRPFLFTSLAVLNTILLVISYFDVPDFSSHPNVLLYNCVSTLSSIALVIDQICKLWNARRRHRPHKAKIYMFSVLMTSSLTTAAWTVWGEGTLQHDYRLLRTASCLFKAVEVMVIFVLAGRSNARRYHEDLQLRDMA